MTAELFPVDVSPWAEWCQAHDHPTIIWNPNANASWCLCGEVRVEGQALDFTAAITLNNNARMWRWGTTKSAEMDR